MIAPLIAITPDCDDGAGRPTEVQYLLRCNYAYAIRRAGGIPVILPYEVSAIAHYVGQFHGFVITGGTPNVTTKPGRTAFEMALIEAALSAGRPLLGICNGMQMIGLHLGGELIASIPDEIASPDEHLPFDVPDRPGHPIAIRPGTRLARLASGISGQVNSLHRQAVKGEGRFVVSAQAPDGVTEAIEGQLDSYCLGLQWHPEYRLTALDRAILDDFVAACRAEVSGAACPGGKDLQ